MRGFSLRCRISVCWRIFSPFQNLSLLSDFLSVPESQFTGGFFSLRSRISGFLADFFSPFQNLRLLAGFLSPFRNLRLMADFPCLLQNLWRILTTRKMQKNCPPLSCSTVTLAKTAATAKRRSISSRPLRLWWPILALFLSVTNEEYKCL